MNGSAKERQKVFFRGLGFTGRVNAGWERRRFAAYRGLLPIAALAILLSDLVEPGAGVSPD